MAEMVDGYLQILNALHVFVGGLCMKIVVQRQ